MPSCVLYAGAMRREEMTVGDGTGRPADSDVKKVQARGGSLEIAFEQHYLSLLRFSVLMTGTRDMAEDLVQDAFVRCAGRIEGLPSPAAASYLRRTVINLWKNHVRRLATERRIRRERAPATEGSPEPAGPEERDELIAALSKLPRGQRACLVLRFYEDLSEQETAQILGCSVGTVKSQTARGLERLRRELPR